MRCVSGSRRTSISESERFASSRPGARPPSVPMTSSVVGSDRIERSRFASCAFARCGRRSFASSTPSENARKPSNAPDEARRAAPTTASAIHVPSGVDASARRARSWTASWGASPARVGPCPSCGRRDTAGRASVPRPLRVVMVAPAVEAPVVIGLDVGGTKILSGPRRSGRERSSPSTRCRARTDRRRASSPRSTRPSKRSSTSASPRSATASRPTSSAERAGSCAR